MATRVAQWATGTTGRKPLAVVIDAPDLDSVAVRVYDPGQVGLDSGALARRAVTTGIRATDGVLTWDQWKLLQCNAFPMWRSCSLRAAPGVVVAPVLGAYRWKD